MSKIRIGMLALAAGFLFQGVAPRSAEAMTLAPAAQALEKSASGSGIIQVHGRRHYGHRHWGHRHWGPRVHAYRGYGGCHWLKRRAIYTGSRYWWRRYNACRFGW